MGVEQKLGSMGIVTHRLEDLVNWGRTNAMWPLLFGLACCAIEMMGAQASNYEQPEVHVAMAALLAETPAPKPSRKDAKILKRDGVVDYPDGEINRYGEALSELAWARAQADSQGERYPYRGPEYKQRAQQLEQRIRAFYPYPVKFNEDSNTVLTFEAAGGGKDIEIDAPNGQRESVFAAAGKQVEVTIQTPGLVTIKVGKQRLALYTEPYTHLHIKL